MRIFVTLTAVGLAALTGLATPASAQVCTLSGPNVHPNVVAITTGSWAFKLSGFNLYYTIMAIASVGTFKAGVGTTSRSSIPQGITSSTVTINTNGADFTTLQPVAGTWTLDPGPGGDCTSGTLQVASGTNPASVRSLRFVLYQGSTKMFLVSTDNDGLVLTGDASRM